MAPPPVTDPPHGPGVLLAACTDAAAWLLPSGEVALDLGGHLQLLCAGDRLFVSYGGLSAAIGIVPYELWLVRDDHRHLLLAAGIDETSTDESALACAQELEAVAAIAAARAGAAVEPRLR